MDAWGQSAGAKGKVCCSIYTNIIVNLKKK